MKKFLLIVLSIVPIPMGFLMDYLIRVYDLYGMSIYLMSFLVILLWCGLGFLSSKVCNHPIEALFLGHFAGIFCMVLILVQFIAIGHFSLSWVGIFPQMYFIPTMGLVALIDVFSWVQSMLMFFIVNLAVMMIVYYLGYRIGKRT